MDIFEEAIAFAVRAHSGMKRKASGQPYILHPMEAAAIVGSMSNDPELLAAAMLHDVVEDAGVTLEQLRECFGERVMKLVAAETEDKQTHLPASATWEDRKRSSLVHLERTEDLGVKMLWLGDKLSNLRSIRQGWKSQGDAFWQNFNQKDPQRHHWYYRAVADATRALSGYEAWQDFDRLICELFESK